MGTALLQCLLNWAESNPLIEKVGLGVFSANGVAVSMYRNFGFVEEGRQPRDVGGGQKLDHFAGQKKPPYRGIREEAKVIPCTARRR